MRTGVVIAAVAAIVLGGCAALIGIEETEVENIPPDASFEPCGNPALGPNETEPNNTVPLAQELLFISQNLDGLAICPAGEDIDVFEVDVPMGLSFLRGSIQFSENPPNNPLRLELLDVSEMSRSTSTPGTDNPDFVEVRVDNPPPGPYYFRVSPLGPNESAYTLDLFAPQ